MRGRGGGEGVRHGEGAGVAAVPRTVSGSGLYFGDGRVDGKAGGALVVTLRIIRVEVDLKIFVAMQKTFVPITLVTWPAALLPPSPVLLLDSDSPESEKPES